MYVVQKLVELVVELIVADYLEENIIAAWEESGSLEKFVEVPKKLPVN